MYRPFLGILTILLVGSAPATERVLLEENFDSGLPSGWISEGLWHHTTACEQPVDGAVPGWIYFGIDGSCSFETGATVTGRLATPPICLPANAARVTLAYRSRYAGDSGQSEISGTDWAWAGTFRDVYDDVSGDGDQGDWQTRTVDLTPADIRYGRFYWHFDSVNAASNDELGWLIDDVRITVEIAEDNRVENLTSGMAFGNLAAAIDAAVPGDELVAYPGEYLEGIVLDKNILIRSLDPNDEAVVRATRIDGPGDSVRMTDGTLRGFLVTGTYSCSFLSGSAIVASGKGAVEQCIVSDTYAPKTSPVILSETAVLRRSVVELNVNGVSSLFAVQVSGDAQVLNNTIRDNDQLIGALHVTDRAIAAGNIIVDNHADSDPGGVLADGESILFGNFVSRIRTGNGHVGVVARGRAQVLYNTITRNGTSLSSGGLWVDGETVVRGNIVAYNLGLGDLGIRGSAAEVDYNCVFGNRCAIADVCAAYGEGSITPGPHDIVTDPRLAEDGDGFRLLPDSSCINAGDPNHPALPGEVDIDGNPRVTFGRIDIGAFEAQQLPCNAACDVAGGDADVTGDCRVDLSDLARLLSSYGQSAGAQHSDGDTDFDGDVDDQDLMGMLSRFGADCLE